MFRNKTLSSGKRPLRRVLASMTSVNIPAPASNRIPVSGVTLLLLTLTFGVLAFSHPSDANAQAWRRKTPRDTVRIQANSFSWFASKLSLVTGMQIQARFLGTFGMFSGQNGKGFDTRYTYEQPPGWAAPLPLLNPPDFNGKKHNIYLAVNLKSPQLSTIGEPVKVIETTYQTNHIYTARFTSLGIPPNFRIHADNGTANNYYSNGSGHITVELAQWTAGISMRSKTLAFGTVPIGTAKPILDSIASYGIDPLQIDSFRVVTSTNQVSKDFLVTSQRGSSFTLANESVNEFKVTFSPSARGDVLAFLQIYCKNTDGANSVKVVQLTGNGVSPSIAIGPPTIDFGKVRVGKNGKNYVNIANGGNGTLSITSTVYTGDNVFSGSPNAPFSVSAGSVGNILVTFAPTQIKKYRGVLTVKGLGVPTDSVIFFGEGAAPELTYSDTTLLFGSVRRGDNSVRYLTIKNEGLMTANVLNMELTGPNRGAYRIEPDPYPRKYLLDPGDSLVLKIIFEPMTGPAGSRTAYIDVAQDDGRPAKRVYLIGFEVEPTMLLGRTIVDFGNVKIGVTKWDTVSMFNSSNAELTVYDVRRQGPMPDYNMFNHDPNWPKVLMGLAKDTIRISFTPTDRREFSTWLHTSVNGQRDSVFLTGRGVWPKSAFAPHDLDFGVVPTNWSTNLVTVLRDTGDYKMDVCKVEVTGTDKDYFKVKSTNPPLPATLIEQGAGMNIAVEFKTNDQTGRSYSAWLKVTYCDGSADSIRLFAKEQQQFLSFGQRTVDFGKIRVRTALDKPAYLSNGSNAKLSAGQIFIAADQSSSNPLYFTTEVTSAVIDEKSQGPVNITFAPLTKGEFTGYLHARGGDIQTDSILLRGIGATPIPKFSDTVIHFGTIIIPGSKVEKLKVNNIGNWMLKARIAIVNDLHNEFEITLPSLSSNIDSIVEADSTEYPITFTPKTPQLIHTADVKFVLDDSSTYIVKLIALDESLYINLDSTHINFGKVRVPQTRSTQVNVVNTSATPRFAEEVSLEPPSGVITATPLGRIDVDSRSSKPIDIQFSPTALGTYSAKIVAKGGDIEGQDTVYITGIGAMPVPKLSDNTLDFGTRVLGDSWTLPTTIGNDGNWEMHITKVEVVGANQNDFIYHIANDTTIGEGGSRTFSIDFLATTALQTNPRTAELQFTLDDGTSFKIDLIARDKMPIPTDIGFGEYYARPGDKIYAVLRLKTPIPDEIVTREIVGSINYDASLVDLLTVEKFDMMLPPTWRLDTSNVRTPGTFTFELSSETEEIRSTGALMRFIFQAKKDLDKTAQSPLRLVDLKYPDTREVVAALNDGIIIIDSSCGATQLTIGSEVMTSFISQNTPNPFGGSTGSNRTTIPMIIAKDDTEVTIRILDATGREMLRPVDAQRYNKGAYEVHVDAASLGSGTYIYEFSASGQIPVTKKMSVRD